MVLYLYMFHMTLMECALFCHRVSSRNADVDEFVRFLHSQFNERPYTVAKVVKVMADEI